MKLVVLALFALSSLSASASDLSPGEISIGSKVNFRANPDVFFAREIGTITNIFSDGKVEIDSSWVKKIKNIGVETRCLDGICKGDTVRYRHEYGANFTSKVKYVFDNGIVMLSNHTTRKISNVAKAL